MFHELDRQSSIFDLPSRKFVLGDAKKDLSVTFHGHRPSTPFGPAAGPQSQMAQNIVLSWLAGGRVIELKTVQIKDRLEIPRPCIDMQTVGYNVEWSQELELPRSLEEYVKGSMLIDILVASKKLPLAPGFERVVYDMSVGYDLAGIRSEPVQAFVRGMRDASQVVERLRKEIPDEYRAYRDLDFTTRLSDTLTLSTFHGCPPDEIERIMDFLLEDLGLHAIVKLNPMLNGPEETRRLLHEVLGYDEIRVPDSAFERDTRWAQAVDFVGRLHEKAKRLGLGFGVKLSNTLIVENHRRFFPASEKEMYLSGPPLHVLAMNLVRRVRRTFGDRFPISFSAGIDRANFPDAVALGLVPITVCSDLLLPGGYGRAQGYFKELSERMDAVGASDVDAFVLRAYAAGTGDLSEARLKNTEVYVERVLLDPRYGKEKNSKLPKKIGRKLVLFDCITCDKCIPVCPNDANFSFVVPRQEIPVVRLSRNGEVWERAESGVLAIREKHQIASFADFCNECGNCDVFCPEDGGPYVVKPRFFGSAEDWRTMRHLDGFHLSARRVLGRFSGKDFVLELAGGEARYEGEGFEVRFRLADPEGTIEGNADGAVDLTYFRIMELIRESVLAKDAINYVRFLVESSAP